jgi:hypothetical protein
MAQPEATGLPHHAPPPAATDQAAAQPEPDPAAGAARLDDGREPPRWGWQSAWIDLGGEG